MATTPEALFAKLKRAYARREKATLRYKSALLKLYMPAVKDKHGNVTAVKGVFRECFSFLDGTFYGTFATELSKTFYRRRKNGRFYEKPQDCLNLLELERACMTTATDFREIWQQLEALGINPLAKRELWQ